MKYHSGTGSTQLKKKKKSHIFFVMFLNGQFEIQRKNKTHPGQEICS